MVHSTGNNGCSAGTSNYLLIWAGLLVLWDTHNSCWRNMLLAPDSRSVRLTATCYFVSDTVTSAVRLPLITLLYNIFICATKEIHIGSDMLHCELADDLIRRGTSAIV